MSVQVHVPVRIQKAELQSAMKKHISLSQAGHLRIQMAVHMKKRTMQIKAVQLEMKCLFL
jgi:LEA14-like dessication related protein